MLNSIVIAGLDPAIHPFRKNKKMDARVKPAHDGGEQRFNSSGIRCSVPATAPSWAAIAVCKGPETKGQYRSRSVTTTLRESPLWRTIKSGVLMKQIEHLPAVVLCATLVLPCSTLRPREIQPRRTRPPWRGRMQSKPGERSRPGCASCRSFRRAPRRQPIRSRIEEVDASCTLPVLRCTEVRLRIDVMGHSRRRQPRPSVHALPLLLQKLT